MERLRRSGRIEEALALLATLAAEAPSDGRVAFEWGMTLAHWAGRPDEARVQFDRALEIAPGTAGRALPAGPGRREAR